MRADQDSTTSERTRAEDGKLLGDEGDCMPFDEEGDITNADRSRGDGVANCDSEPCSLNPS